MTDTPFVRIKAGLVEKFGGARRIGRRTDSNFIITNVPAGAAFVR